MKRNNFGCAVITGASMGLGRAIACEAAARGLEMVLTALPGSGLPEFCDCLTKEHNARVHFIEGDLTTESTVDELTELVISRGLKPDLLINNAGVGTIAPFEDSVSTSLDATIQLNALALVRMTRAFLSWVRRDEDGAAHCSLQSKPRHGLKAQIVNVASLGAFFPMPTLAVYSATKSFVLELSLAIREELQGRIGVTVLCPNAIRTTPAVEEYVERFGLLARLTCHSPELIARSALNGAEINQAIVIPGHFNRILAIVGQVLPKTFVMRVIRSCWSGFGSANRGG